MRSGRRTGRTCLHALTGPSDLLFFYSDVVGSYGCVVSISYAGVVCVSFRNCFSPAIEQRFLFVCSEGKQTSYMGDIYYVERPSWYVRYLNATRMSVTLVCGLCFPFTIAMAAMCL